MRVAMSDPAILEAVFHRMQDAVFVLGHDDRVVDLNRAARQLLGRRPEQPIGRSTGEVLAAHRPLLAALADLGLGEDEVTLRAPDGPRHYQLRIQPLLSADGGSPGRLLVLHDITDYAAAMGELHRAEVRKAAVLEASLDCVITLDAEGRVAEFNPAAEATFGLPRDRVIGRPLTDFLTPDEGTRLAADLQTFLCTGSSPGVGRRREAVSVRADGSEFPAEITVVALDDPPQPAFTIFLRDITERRQIESLKEELVATVSHELRTPLTSLRGFAELLLEREFPPEKAKHFLGMIRDEATRLARLVDDFLDLKTLEFGRLVGEPRPVALLDAVERAAASLGGLSPSHVLTVDVPDSVPPLAADPDRLHQVLTNLLSNAIKFSPDGGTVAVQARTYGTLVLISVQDPGLGISPQDQKKLFGRFFRSDAVRKRHIRGTGLGLALVKQIVEGHGGRIDVESAVGRGSLFRITLPAWDGEDTPG